jgi:hypothetical protein
MKPAQFHPKKTLVPQPIKNGARMWSEAFTQNCSAIAVDALSPVMEKCRKGKQDISVLENEIILAGCIGMKP